MFSCAVRLQFVNAKKYFSLGDSWQALTQLVYVFLTVHNLNDEKREYRNTQTTKEINKNDKILIDKYLKEIPFANNA